MPTPKFGDLGKACSDLFSDDFKAGSNKLTLKSKTASGTSLKLDGSRNNSSGAVTGSLETKFSHKASGLNVKEKWDTSNTISTELSTKNLLTAGTDFSFTTDFKPTSSGLQSFKLKGSLVRDNFAVDANTNLKGVNAAGVFSYGKFFVGASSNLSNTKIGASFVEKDYSITSTVSDGRAVDIQVFHNARSDLQTAVQFGWKANGGTSLAVAGKLALDDSAYVKAKINKDMQVGLAYVQKIRNGVTLGLSAQLEATNLASSGHQLGFNLTLDN